LGDKLVANPAGFRWRSTESSRIEELSDAVIGFSLTLLVVSLEVPETFDELLNSIRGFGAFAASFGLLIVIWYEHYTFFRRYALQDTYIIAWNTVLLFLIVFYVYPLKFLFTLFFNEVFGMSFLVTLPGGIVAPMIREGQLPQLYIIFGIGWTAVWMVFVLLYRHALHRSVHLELNSVEVFDTRASITENLFASGVGILSIVLVIIGATGLAGWVYLVMFPMTWVIKRRNALRRPTLDIGQIPAASNE
jgi:uncharacterized membrane protein